MPISSKVRRPLPYSTAPRTWRPSPSSCGRSSPVASGQRCSRRSAPRPDRPRPDSQATRQLRPFLTHDPTPETELAVDPDGGFAIPAGDLVVVEDTEAV